MFWTILSSLRFAQDIVWPWAEALSLCEGEAKGKNLILFRVSNSEESPQETLRLRLRVTRKKVTKRCHSFTLLRTASYSVILSEAKNPLRMLSFWPWAEALSLCEGEAKGKNLIFFSERFLGGFTPSEWRDELNTALFYRQFQGFHIIIDIWMLKVLF